MTSWASRLSIGVAVLLSAALVTGAGLYLARTTSGARAGVLADFDARARVAGQLIGGTLGASDAKTRAVAVTQFSGTPAQLRAQLGTPALDTAWYAVLDADGGLLVADPVTATASARAAPVDSGFRIAASTGRLAFGDVRDGDDGPAVLAFQPFEAPDGVRMVVVPIPVSELSVIVSGALGVSAATSHVIDGAGRVIVSTDGTAPGVPLPDQALAGALRTHTSGVTGDDYFSAHAVAGSDWRLVMTAPQASLLAPVESTGRVAWQLFAAFAAAMLAIVLIGLSALARSARLARARLHDALTGLPNRALILERVDEAVAARRRTRPGGSEGMVAVLFLDLDGFKPVNDAYGHAAGDALLKQVAARLTDTIRPEDTAGRFGGDEFLVLCRGLPDRDDARAIADRIRRRISEPYDVGGHTVIIGASIGIAVLDDGAQEPDALIHSADLALYRAKEGGRGRVEVFTGG
ncbi:GGDEF domain-containing protein [Catenuloplanes atrovinosus]|uniref:Diguanylate cyclase (GGDEF)-like protein n=1 Tax=Catenuloplanes atrovinosus TaxID=137266 RepID=A0AAE4CBH8_9ACTN|nr:GGDEF domain-containing protein [Catenuloplanes atrovinosus]MDR7276929.1 diguanylate cyclase (GGDEF)-like protein [Catenuloplanes atrovinosus]